MPKTTKSEQMDFEGLEIIADEVTANLNGKVASAAVSAVTSVTSANASDLATAITLVNELKTDFNALLAALKV